MTFPKSDVIWMNGKLVPWDDANIHIASHVIHYGSAVFEGVRCYNTPEGPAIFRLDAHTERLFNSAKIYRMDMPYTFEELSRAQLETVAANKKEACYIRPIVYRGYEQLGVNPFPCPVDVAIMVWDWGRYLGKEALETGVDVCVSSWARIAPNTLPAMAKTAANYMNSQLIKMEAIKAGYVEGIALDSDGYLSEGSGENLFLVKNGTLLTPAPRILGPAGHHARHRRATGAAAADPGGGSAAAPRDALHLGRGLHDRHRRRDHPRAVRGQDHDRQGRARTGDGSAAEGVLRRDRVPGPRRVRMAHPCPRRQRGGLGGRATVDGGLRRRMHINDL
jgi:branched-chain amino acid aminotransferase